MDEFVFKLPDLGEGVVEGEIVEWHVGVGHVVVEDGPLVDVMTDKATVTISSVVSGTVVRLNGRVGETISVGNELVRIDTTAVAQAPSIKIARGTQQSSAARSIDANSAGNGSTANMDAGSNAVRAPALPAATAASVQNAVEALATKVSATAPKPLASPAVRRRAREKGLDLQQIVGTGRNGQITDTDLESYQHRTEIPLSNSLVHESERVERLR